jgi:hypothetical protein
MESELLKNKNRRLSDWLEDQLKEINQKVDHIIFRLRYEDPRIWTPPRKKTDREDYTR